jgi:hypothetical protein
MGASIANVAPLALWRGLSGGDLLGLFFGNLLLPALLVAPVLPPAPKRGETLEDAVVATDPVSVDADYDNGTSLQRQACARLS